MTAPGRSRDVVLAVGAHPDDLEFQCGGTLAALVARGVEVHMAVVTDGSCGSFALPAPEIARIRLEEARRSADIVGATSFEYLGMHDGASDITPELRRTIVNHVRRVGASVILGHPPGDYHLDHRNASQLAFEARCCGAMPNFADEPPLPATPHLAYFDTEQGVGFEPQIWIDISAHIDVKRRMLAAHDTQLQLMKTMYGEDMLAMVDRHARFRGGQRASDYAEAYRGCDIYPEPDGALRFLVRTLEGA